MLRMTLDKNLFQPNRRAYAVLDGASVPELPQRLYDLAPRHVCLYRGELRPDIAEVAPYLVEIENGSPFAEWLFDASRFDTHFGIFAATRYSLVEARKHFRRYLTVYTDAGKPLLFRFYDPRVLEKFLPNCGRKDLGGLFAGIDFFLAENGRSGFTRFTLADDKLNITEL